MILCALVGVLRLLPLVCVAWLGRWAGWLAWIADRRHRAVAVENIALAFPGKSPAAVRDLARENFRRIGESYACAIRTPGMRKADLDARIDYVGLEAVLPTDGGNVIVATGHFGSFDLLAHAKTRVPHWTIATTYRAQRVKAIDAVLQRIRNMTGVRFIERREGISAVRSLFGGGNTILALYSDQHGGGKGLWLPFLGRECSCSPAPVVLALRHNLVLVMGVCYRTALARWRIEIGPVIPTRNTDGTERPVEAVTLDINREYEVAIRRDPANWFWVHRRWKPSSSYQRTAVNAAAARESNPEMG